MIVSVEQVIGAFVSLLIGTLLGKEITRYLYKPKVFIRYKNLSPLTTEDGCFWSIKVANLGRTVAKDCIGTITLLDMDRSKLMDVSEADSLESLPEYKEENITLDFPRFQIMSPATFRLIESEPLCWAELGNPQRLDINPGMTQQLDVCKIHFGKVGNYIIFPSEHGWRKIRIRTKIRNIKGRIMICPSNEFPTPINFRIVLDEQGQPVFRAETLKFREKVCKKLFPGKYYFN